MALVSNGYGKVINMDINDYLDATDEEWVDIIASGYGEDIENPFQYSFSIKNDKLNVLSDLDDEVLDEIFLEELTTLEIIDDLDLELDLNLEDY